VLGRFGNIGLAARPQKVLLAQVGNAANHGYQYIQAPAANITTTTTTTLSGTGTLGTVAKSRYTLDTTAITSADHDHDDNTNQ